MNITTTFVGDKSRIEQVLIQTFGGLDRVYWILLGAAWHCDPTADAKGNLRSRCPICFENTLTVTLEIGHRYHGRWCCNSQHCRIKGADVFRLLQRQLSREKGRDVTFSEALIDALEMVKAQAGSLPDDLLPAYQRGKAAAYRSNTAYEMREMASSPPPPPAICVPPPLPVAVELPESLEDQIVQILKSGPASNRQIAGLVRRRWSVVGEALTRLEQEGRIELCFDQPDRSGRIQRKFGAWTVSLGPRAVLPGGSGQGNKCCPETLQSVAHNY